MSNFNYNNYIGPHMKEPLRVEYTCLNNERCVAELTGSNKDYLFLSTKNIEDIEVYSKLCKPYIKGVEDLTDEELMYFYYGDSIPESATVKRTNNIVQLIHFGYEEEYGRVTYIHETCNIKKCDEYQFNRLYSMHCHLKAREYIENGLALSYRDLK